MREADYLVIGDTGLIGAALCAHLRQTGASVVGVHTATYAECLGLRARVVINSNGNTYRFRANQDPRWDFEASVATVQRSLFDVQAEVYVYLSTVDVYPVREDPARNDESTPINPQALDVYGFHKWLAERLVERFAPRSVICRVGTVIGEGLRKGPVYDALQGEPLHLAPESELTFIDTATVARAVMAVLAAHPEHDIVNVTGTGSARLCDVAARLPAPLRAAPGAERLVRRYHVNNAKLARFMPVPTSQEALMRYLDRCKAASRSHVPGVLPRASHGT